LLLTEGFIDMQPDPSLGLRFLEIENVFVQITIDLHRILVLDGIDQIGSGFRVRSHDLGGPLPKIQIKDTGDRYAVLDEIQREPAKLCATVRAGKDLAAVFPVVSFCCPPERILVWLWGSALPGER